VAAKRNVPPLGAAPRTLYCERAICQRPSRVLAIYPGSAGVPPALLARPDGVWRSSAKERAGRPLPAAGEGNAGGRHPHHKLFLRNLISVVDDWAVTTR